MDNTLHQQPKQSKQSNKSLQQSQKPLQQKKTLNSLFDRIYVINLKKRPDRMKRMHKLLTKNNITYTRFNAIVGDTRQNRRRYMHRVSPNIKKYFGGIGIFLSWIDILSTCIKNKVNRILIFEDDIYLHRDFNNKLQHAKLHFEHSDIVYLGANQWKWSNRQLKQIHQPQSKNDNCNKNSNNNSNDNSNNNNTDNNSNQLKHYSTEVYTYGLYAVALMNLKTIKKLHTILLNYKNNNIKKIIPIDAIITNEIVNKKTIRACVLYPNLVIPKLYDSDIRTKSAIIGNHKSRKWNTDNYDLFEIGK